jgi:hypothetical protein
VLGLARNTMPGSAETQGLRCQRGC